jgi:hypothetical protein
MNRAAFTAMVRPASIRGEWGENVSTEGPVLPAGGVPAVRRPYRIVLVMKKQDHAWRWQLFSGSVPGSE